LTKIVDGSYCRYFYLKYIAGAVEVAYKATPDCETGWDPYGGNTPLSSP
jgi:hypothetical protein